MLRRLWQSIRRFLDAGADTGLCPICGFPLGITTTARVGSQLVHAGACADEAWERAQW